MRANIAEIILLVCHLREYRPDSVHQLLSLASENHLGCACQSALPVEIDRPLEFRQFAGNEWFERGDALLLLRIIGSELLQFVSYPIEVLYRFVIGFQVGRISREEKAALPSFCINDSSSRLIEYPAEFVAVPPRLGGFCNADRIPVRFPANQRQDDRGRKESREDQAPLESPSHRYTALPASLEIMVS